MTAAAVSRVDLTDLDTFTAGRHHEQLAWLRRHEPVYWHPAADGGGFWVLSRYDDVVTAYRDHVNLSSSGGAVLGGSFRNETDTSSGRMLVSSDPPRHRMLRQVVQRAFTPEMVERIAAQIAVLVDSALDRLIRAGGGDFAADVATQLPAGALMTMMGLSADDAYELIGMTRRMIGFRDPNLVDVTIEERLRLAALQAEIFEFFADRLAHRRGADVGDLLGILSQAEINGRRLTEEEILYNCLNVAVGGNETSSYTACAGLLALMESPDQYDMLRRSPDLLSSGVNEMLRWSSTNAYVQRVALRDMEIGEHLIRAGDAVTLWNVSANYDESQFADPYRFDVERSPNRHLSYGSSVHRCIGAALAHAELGTLFRRLLGDGRRLTPSGPVTRLRSNFILGITHLPVAVTGG